MNPKTALSHLSSSAKIGAFSLNFINHVPAGIPQKRKELEKGVNTL
jgi:hypothetical protein